MVAQLVRIEGEGEVVLVTSNGLIQDIEYRIIEAPRFFEYLVRGRPATIVPDIVSRICGLCGSSYILSATKAFEHGLGIAVPDDVDEVRKAVHLAERLKSHVIHIFLLELPGLAGLNSIIELNKFSSQLVRDISNVLMLSRKAMEILGGRFHNVVNMRIGGVWKTPPPNDMDKLKKVVSDAYALFKRLADFVFSLRTLPDEPQSLVTCCVASDNEYPHMGLYVQCDGERYSAYEFYEKTVEVVQKKECNALLYKLCGKSFVVGPIARYNIAYHKLVGEVRDLVEAYGWGPKLKNIYHSIIARTAETLDALIRLRDFAESYRQIEVKEYAISFSTPRTCFYVIEAPRGILYQRYDVSEKGLVKSSNIITPTAQNIAAMEEIARGALRGRRVDVETIDIARKLAVCFDPCLSCSVHALPVKVVERLDSSTQA